MAKANFFNKGLLKGKMVKSEIVSWEKGDRSGEFLALEIDTGDNNRIKSTIFPTRSNPNKHKEMLEKYPVGSMVEVSGNVQEREYEKNGGGKGVDRSVQGFTIRPLRDESKTMATFIIQGIVEKIKEVSDGVEVLVRVDDSYEKNGETITRSEYFTLEGDVADLIFDLDVVTNCNAKFKGKIFNKLEFDDYGDIVGNVQMFYIEKIENVIPPDELVEADEEFPV